jgi:hypothetical protein
MVQAVLSIDWDLPPNTALMPITFFGKRTRPQLVFWPIHLPAEWFEQGQE